MKEKPDWQAGGELNRIIHLSYISRRISTRGAEVSRYSGQSVLVEMAYSEKFRCWLIALPSVYPSGKYKEIRQCQIVVQA